LTGKLVAFKFFLQQQTVTKTSVLGTQCNLLSAHNIGIKFAHCFDDRCYHWTFQSLLFD